MRSDAREAAFKILFSTQFNPDCTDSFRRAIYRNYRLNESEMEYAERVFQTARDHESEWLKKLDGVVKGYNVQGLYAVDKSILFIAMTEIFCLEDVPNVVAVNEAVGLAKKFSTEKSADFVNGVLASMIN